MKKHVVKYPSSISKNLHSVDTLKRPALRSMLGKANLPKKTLVGIGESQWIKGEGIFAMIVLPSGAIFSGVAIRKPGDHKTPRETAEKIALGRALAVYRHYHPNHTTPLFTLRTFPTMSIGGGTAGDPIMPWSSVSTNTGGKLS